MLIRSDQIPPVKEVREPGNWRRSKFNLTQKKNNNKKIVFKALQQHWQGPAWRGKCGGDKRQNSSFILCVKSITSFVLTFLKSSTTWVGACVSAGLAELATQRVLMSPDVSWCLHLTACALLWNSISSDKSLCFPFPRYTSTNKIVCKSNFRMSFISLISGVSLLWLPAKGWQLFEFLPKKKLKKISFQSIIFFSSTRSFFLFTTASWLPERLRPFPFFCLF